MASLSDAVGLLERALGYAFFGLDAITPEAMSRPTPCREWDLGALLGHVSDSLAALHEAVDDGHVATEGTRGVALAEPGPPGSPPRSPVDPVDPVAIVRDRARRVLGSWVGAGDGDRLVTVGDCPLRAGVVAYVGAIEVAVHGWDIHRACGRPRPIPSALATDLLQLAPVLVTDAERPSRFAAPVPVSPATGAGDRLVAFLGRDPI
jgi:uncharacterized protein (TIGR03086 family)